MPRMIFVNLPVADLERSQPFFSALGFTFDERGGGREHVGVHLVHPREERVEVVARERRLADPVDGDAVALLLGGRVVAAAGQDVDVETGRAELLGELANMPGEPTLDDGRILPGDDQDPHGRREP